MATGKDRAVGRQLRTLFDVGAIRELGDGQLLERFATGRGEGGELAFAALVERHGAMVLRVAQGVLDDPHDAQDAFQATFLVLVAKARGLWVRDSLAPWLHQVAYRTASCLRANAARRRRLERRAAGLIEEAARPAPVDDLARVLLEEVDRLPERYRAPVVLCDLEGRTHEQAARALGWPVGTVKSRQSRARERLRSRLARRGIAPSLGLPAAWPSLEFSIPTTLVDRTTVAAVRYVATRAIAPGTAAVLAREVIRSMIILRWVKAASILVALGAAASSGVGLIAQDEGKKPGEVPKPREIQRVSPAPEKSVVEVKPGKINLTLFERGNLEPAKVQDVVCEIQGGTTIISLKPDGSDVKKGEVVVELDSALLRDTLTNQRITIQQAEAAYKQARLVREVAEYAVKEYLEGIYPADRDTLKATVSGAQLGVDKGQARLTRTKEARTRLDVAKNRRVGAETPTDVVAELTVADRLDEVEIELQRLKLDLEMARSRQDVLEKYTREKQVKSLTNDVEKAKSYELSRLASWQLEQTKAKKLEHQIEKCTLFAPGDGVLILANIPARARLAQPAFQIEEGATVRERQKLFSVVDPADPMRVNAKVHESMVDQVRVGMPVKVQVDAAVEEVLTGVVTSVAPMADTSPPSGDGPKLYTTFVQLNKEDRNLNLRPGMSARVEILIAERDNVLTVPVASVILLDDKTRVAVRTAGGGIELREVTLGVGNKASVEVKSGLQAGDQVILDPIARITDPNKPYTMTPRHVPPDNGPAGVP